ncbi:MAG: hypothetical protein ACOC5R_04260 [Elusimicrobiota bacterium]
MKKKIFSVLLSIIVLCSAGNLYAQKDTVVGGHLRFYLYDHFNFKEFDVVKTGGEQEETNRETNNRSAHVLWLYLKKALSDNVSLSLMPAIYSRSGASPKSLTVPVPADGEFFHLADPNDPNSAIVPGVIMQEYLAKTQEQQKKIDEQLTPFRELIESMDMDHLLETAHVFEEATVEIKLPHQIEMRIGRMTPLITEGYGNQLFWHDGNHSSKVLCNYLGGAWLDNGIELYRNFELGDISFPVWAYGLNGWFMISDNNDSKAYAFRIAPETYLPNNMGKLKIMGAMYRGKWDWEDKHYLTKYSGGLSYQWNKFTLRAEYIKSTLENALHIRDVVIKDANSVGYSAKLYYDATPWLTGLIHYEVLDNDYGGWFWPFETVDEKFERICPVLKFHVADSADITAEYDIGKWTTGENEKVEYDRFTLGMAVTF